MSDDRQDFFDAVFNNSSDDAFPRVSFENRIVRRVFTECGVRINSMGRLVNLCRAETGVPHFRFSWFNARYPNFPATLAGRRIGYCGKRSSDGGATREKIGLYQLDISDLMRPKNNLFIRAMAKALVAEDLSPDFSDTFIFVFPLRRKMFCAHTLGSSLFEERKAVENVHAVLKFEVGGRTLCVQPTEDVFSAIGPDWFVE